MANLEYITFYMGRGKYCSQYAKIKKENECETYFK